MSRFEELARLKELAIELAELKGMRSLPSAKIDRMGEIEEEICCSTDMLLQIAEAFQPGDSIMLRELAHDEEQMAKFVSGFGKPDMRKTAMLRRLQAVAEEMER